jgi:hypothetical protein
MIALITPTGNRPVQFNLCSMFMQRQTYQGKVVWIIVDDCIPITSNIVQENFRGNWTIIKIFPTPPWNQNVNTQARNLAAGFNMLLSRYKKEEIEAIFIIEDDDYYRASYIENMIPRLNGFIAAGEIQTIYYNVAYRQFCTNTNYGHSSLFQTVLKVDAIPILEQAFTDKFIDLKFWTLVQNKNLFKAGDLSIGIKGIPGRYGIGIGHRRFNGWPEDPQMIHLTSWIGTDASLYSSFYLGSRKTQLFHKR